MIDPATRIGAVHLTIADLVRSIRFYQSRLGFAVHRDRPRPLRHPLRNFEVTFADEAARAPAVDRVRTAGVGVEPAEHGLSVCDPGGNTILLSVR